MKEKPTLGFWQVWNMSFGFLGIQFGFALQNGNASRILLTFGADVHHLSWFWLVAPITGMIVQPIVGYLSDKTWCRLGRRRPYFLAGAFLTSIALILMPNAPHLASFIAPMFIGGGLLMIMDASINISMSKKYFRVPLVGQSKTAAPQNLPIIRSAELYLWRAALKQVTNKGGQAADLNLVRQRAWDVAKSGAYVPITDAQATWDLIDQEWVKEMAFEGDRVIWLQMFKKPIGPGDRTVADVAAPYANFFYPIPLSETDFNPKN